MRCFPAYTTFLITMLAFLPSTLLSQKTAPPKGSTPVPNPDASFRNEIVRSIDRGTAWLKKNADPAGFWSTQDQPAVTALALLALKGDPGRRYDDDPVVKKGYETILAAAKPDGGIHQNKLVTYNTALALMALLAADKPAYDEAALKARQFLINLQVDFGTKGTNDTPFDGGVGYGSKYQHSDMGNTLQALEAIYYSKRLVRDQPPTAGQDLNWAAAIHFLQSCQNLPSHNKETWASNDATNKGGFIYYPGHSMAGGTTNSATGRVALRSYGSISYGGMLSYAYADLKNDDPRVSAVFDWLRRNYTLEENPGMGPQGLFYYFHTMAKALTAYGINKLELADGRKIDWRRELAMELIGRQQNDGSWVNKAHARWWENDPALVTSYGVLTLEMIARSLQ